MSFAMNGPGNCSSVIGLAGSFGDRASLLEQSLNLFHRSQQGHSTLTSRSKMWLQSGSLRNAVFKSQEKAARQRRLAGKLLMNSSIRYSSNASCEKKILS